MITMITVVLIFIALVIMVFILYKQLSNKIPTAKYCSKNLYWGHYCPKGVLIRKAVKATNNITNRVQVKTLEISVCSRCKYVLCNLYPPSNDYFAGSKSISLYECEGLLSEQELKIIYSEMANSKFADNETLSPIES